MCAHMSWNIATTTLDADGIHKVTAKARTYQTYPWSGQPGQMLTTEGYTTQRDHLMMKDATQNLVINSLGHFGLPDFSPLRNSIPSLEKSVLQYVLHISANIGTQQWNQGLSGLSSGRRNHAKRRVNIHKILSTVFLNLSWSVFKSHIFKQGMFFRVRVFIQANKAINTGKRLLPEADVCENLMTESYLNAAILEVQFEERFNLWCGPDEKRWCIRSMSAWKMSRALKATVCHPSWAILYGTVHQNQTRHLSYIF